MGKEDWNLVSTHGAVLYCIAARRACTVKELAQDLSLTSRQVSKIIHDLRGSGMLRVRRDGRRHRYDVNLDAPLLHPVVKGYSLRHVMGDFVRQARRHTVTASNR